MKLRFDRDLPKGGTTAVIALALLASVVTGREQAPPDEVVQPSERRAVEPPRAAEPEALDIAKLSRERGAPVSADLFANRVAAPPPAPVVVAPPPAPEPPAAPVAPRLPYAYLGQMKKGERVLIYLLKDQELIVTQPGATLEREYRVEGITDTAVHFVYLPLDQKQLLAIPTAQ